MAYRTSDALPIRADEAARAIGRLPPHAALAREMRAVRRAEIFSSTALAGSALTPAEVDALLDLGRAQGNHAFADYVLVLTYADAARWIADERVLAPGDIRPLLGVEELRQLNARVTAGARVRGGAWRQANLAPESGIVAPAAWMVARDVTALLDRSARRPPSGPVSVWLARFLGRLHRLRPFEGANGRTARLGVNLMLRRLDYPPLLLEQRDRARFPAALAAAATNDPARLATILASALLRVSNRLSAATETAAAPLSALRVVAGDDYLALAKAAQRGSLRTIVRGGRYFTTPAWVDEYQRARRGRRRSAGAADDDKLHHQP